MTASGSMSSPKNRSNRMSAEPEWGLNCGCLASWNNPLTENSDPGHGMPGNLQGHPWAPEPPPSFPPGCNDSEGSTRRSSPLWRPSPCRCAVSAACPPCLVLAIWNRTFSLGENIIVFLATCLILQSQYLRR